MVPAASDLEAYRVPLTGHCYRMLGSALDAEDAVQETLVRAWRGREGWDGRASLKNWLYRIATHVCIDALAERKRRVLPLEEGAAGTVHDELAPRPRTHWLEPVAEARAIPAGADPAEQLALRQSVRLAFVAALQHLPAKQRAVLLLTDVVGWSAAEAAEGLSMTVPAVNSALQRARATLKERDPSPAASELSPAQATLVERYVAAFERYDVQALTAVLHEDVTMCMPPASLWLRGPEAVVAWLLGRGSACRGSRLIPVAAAGQPAFAQYKPDPDTGGFRAWALLVLEVGGDGVTGQTFFLDTEALFPLFGLPLLLPAGR